MPLALLTSSTPGTSYWGSLPTGLNQWSSNVDGDLYPDADGTQDLGLVGNRVQRLHGNAVALSSSYSPIEPVATQASIALHHSAVPIGGYATASRGSIVAVNSLSSDASSAFDGSIAHGNIASTYGSVQATEGGFAGGYLYGGSISASYGAIAHGQVDGGGVIIASLGSLSSGKVVNGSYIQSGNGGLAGGFASTGGYILSHTALGAMAFGHVVGYTIAASGNGAVAMGNATGGNILAQGAGSMAFGSAAAGGIVAQAEGSVQINEGTNNVAFSFKVGDDTYGIRLIGNGIGTTRNGDIWCDGYDVFVRTGGVNKNISDIP